MSALEFILDGQRLEARDGESILQAALRHGVQIPHLCFKEGLRAEGNCRACMVEIDGERVLAPSCCRAPAPGQQVKAASPRARKAQQGVIELLLADAPAAGANQHREGTGMGDSELLHWARHLGLTQSRFPARSQPAPDLSHPAMAVNLEACIQCTRCVRACREEQVNDVIGLAWRGEHAAIVFDQGDAMGASSCVACGECVQACPTGALMPKMTARAQPAAAQAGASVAAAGAVAAGAGAVAAGAIAAPALRAVDSLCPFCGVGCQLTYQVQGERIAFVEGRDGPANHGRLCVKGRFGFDYAMSPQRLTRPLIRKPGMAKHPDFGKVPADWREQFREASWEEALALAGQRLRAIRDGQGKTALAGFGSAKGSNEEAYLFQKLVRVGFGSNNVDHCTRLCHASSVAALLEGVGSAAVSNQVSDVALAEVVIVIGANPTVNHPVAATWIKNAIRRGTRLILADPRRTELARHAELMLQFKPDTDVALLNAMLYTIIEEGLTDKAFIAARVSDFAALESQVRSFSPEAMAPVCGIDAATIRQAARLYATSRASMILWGMGVSQHVHGTDNARCLIALAMITGQIGRPGTGLHPLRGQNNVQGASDAGLIPMFLPDYQRVAQTPATLRFEKLWDLPEGGLSNQPGLTVVEILDAIDRGDIRGMYIMGENPAMSDPDLHHARRALASLDCLVVQDIFPTETAYLADIILPASAFPEKSGSFTNTDRMVQLARQAVAPPGEARQDLWIINQMARQMGLDWHYEDPGEVFEEMRRGMDSIRGISWRRLQREGSVTYPCHDEQSPGESVEFAERFATADGRAHLKPAGLIRANEPPDAEYPLVLITGRQLEHWHTGAMTRPASVLSALEPEPVVSLCSAQLQALGLQPGDPVRVRSRRGAVTLRTRCDEGVSPGQVFMPFAFAEAAANLLTNPALDPFGKIPEFKYCAVRLEPVSA